ncbi:hypothetical protein ACHAXR_007157 [Thalassiosira sp. AJA248-18]
MVTFPSKLTLVTIYAIVATIALSHHYVREYSSQLKQKSPIDENAVYEKHFLPSSRHHHNVSVSSRLSAVSADAQPAGRFPIKTHIITHGKPRTATTLLFNMVAVSYFVYLVENDPEQIPEVELIYWRRPNGYKKLDKSKKPIIAKTHESLDNFLSNNTVIFTAAVDKSEGGIMREDLERDGHTVAFVQDMESLREDGVQGLVQVYVAGYGLSEKDQANLNEYFTKWEILRQCCGQQMSARWRNDMMPEKFKISQFKSHPTCPNYDIDSIEQAFMKTELYSLIETYPNMQPLNRPSLNDANLNGTYCSSYNHLVRTQGLSIWGKPGGRPVRSNLDGAIKDQMKRNRENLKPDAYHLFPSADQPQSERLRAMWHKPEKEKKAWLRAVLAAREGGKSYSDYKIEPTIASADADDNRGDVNDEVEGQETDDNDAIASADDQESGNDSANSENDNLETNRGDYSNGEDPGTEPEGSDHDVEATTNGFDITHAVFLISFGKEASDSTLVERCILSLRRRGAWDGFIVVLTDAPPERYQNKWDGNVIVMHPSNQHLNAPDGSPLKFTKDNTSLKSKRFKTFIIDYIGYDKRLDSVELIYYLDIDIMAGDAMGGLFSSIERKYDVSREERSGGLSKLFFFTPLSKEWPFQGGTFIVERRSSMHCLELWRREIDDMTISGRGRDQDGLRTIHQRIQLGEESKCELVRMENENFISFPTPRTFDKIIRSPRSTLIHISNSVFAKRIDEEAQTKYIHEVLDLSEEEKQLGNYGKAIVHAKKSDM